MPMTTQLIGRKLLQVEAVQANFGLAGLGVSFSSIGRGRLSEAFVSRDESSVIMISPMYCLVKIDLIITNSHIKYSAQATDLPCFCLARRRKTKKAPSHVFCLLSPVSCLLSTAYWHPCNTIFQCQNVIYEDRKLHIIVKIEHTSVQTCQIQVEKSETC